MIILAWIIFIYMIVTAILNILGMLNGKGLNARITSFIALLLNGTIVVFFYLYLFK